MDVAVPNGRWADIQSARPMTVLGRGEPLADAPVVHSRVTTPLRTVATVNLRWSNHRRMAGANCSPLRRGIGRAILMHKPPVGIGTHHVDIGASREVVRVS